MNDAPAFAEVYEELRALARTVGRGLDSSLQPTALVHEVWLRLGGTPRTHWESASHFRAVAARAMRQILIDRARRVGALKRGGGWPRVTLPQIPGEDASVISLRIFAGMEHAEIAQMLGSSERTVRRTWRRCRAWLISQLATGPAPDGPPPGTSR